MIEASPGVRRLCMCVYAPRSGLLDAACHVGRLGAIYTEHVPDEGLDLGFATPGVDEAALVSDTIAALCTVTAGRGGSAGAARAPSVAAFHVGITRVEGDNLGGAAVARVRDLLQAITAVAAGKPAALAVGISTSLFDDIRVECDFGPAWTPLAASGGWFRVFQAAAGHGGLAGQ
jgi:hypothetical protein